MSALTGHPVRHDIAMTGEISLRGRVLPIGGLKEKSLAAHRGEITTIIIPAENEKDQADVPEAVRDALEMQTVTHVDEVLVIALQPRDGAVLFHSVPKEAPELEDDMPGELTVTTEQ